jgi:hypothetical protein
MNDMLARTRGNRFARAFGNDRRNPMQTPAPSPAATPAATPAPTPAATLPLPSGVAQGPQNAAFNAFYNTPLYQVPLQEGLDSINAHWAARGGLESGAAMKGISDYTAGHAAGGLRDYMSLLGNQQAIGFNATSAQAGAAQNYANSIQGSNQNYANAMQGANSAYANNASNAYGGYASGINNALGQLGQGQAQGAINAGNINANAITANANNTNAMIGGLGSAFGSVANYYAYRPYAGGSSMPTSGWGTPGIY